MRNMHIVFGQFIVTSIRDPLELWWKLGESSPNGQNFYGQWIMVFSPDSLSDFFVVHCKDDWKRHQHTMFLTNSGQWFKKSLISVPWLRLPCTFKCTYASEDGRDMQWTSINHHINRSFILDVFWGKGGSSAFVFGLLPALTIGG